MDKEKPERKKIDLLQFLRDMFTNEDNQNSGAPIRPATKSPWRCVRDKRNRRQKVARASRKRNRG